MSDQLGQRGSDDASAHPVNELRRACVVALLALAITALIETSRVPWHGLHRWLQVVVGSYAFSLLHVLEDLLPAVLFVPLVGLVSTWQRHGDPIGRRFLHDRRLITAIAAAIKFAIVYTVLASAYEKLVLYPDFGRYAPATTAFIALFVAISVVIVPGGSETDGSRKGALRAVYRVGLPVVALLAAFGCFAIDAFWFKREYPTLHVSLLQVAHLFLALGLWRAASLLPARTRPRASSRVQLLGWATVAVLCLLAKVAAASSVGARAYPFWSAHTTLGQSQAVFRSYREPERRTRIVPATEARARALFRAHSGLPELPADFDLLKYNVLLLQSEATRFDQTSLSARGPDTTPTLRKLRERGAYNFTRAYSAASSTFQSTAGLHGMSHPSALEIELWAKPWQGRYLDPHPLPAELFAQAGYDTFWIGHDKASSFSTTALGFDRGFHRRVLLTNEQSHKARADQWIADAAIAELSAKMAAPQRGSSPNRFFGWIFFVSPHNNYDRHYSDRPAATQFDLYLQEIAYVDEQIARVLGALEEQQLLDSTIVLYTADHGEEFGEHGGRMHGGSMYTELTNVPLLVWLPGVPGATLERPTSTTYLFPWLFSRGSPAMQQAALHRLRHQIGPMLERTSGAVVTELVASHRVGVALVYDDRKFNYDFHARLHQAFRVDRDRLEQHDLFERDPALTFEAEARIAAYLDVRANLRAFQLRPDRRDPRDM